MPRSSVEAARQLAGVLAKQVALAFTHLILPKYPKDDLSVVLFGDEIPVTSTGKYQRNRLKPLFSRWKSTQFTESVRG